MANEFSYEGRWDQKGDIMKWVLRVDIESIGAEGITRQEAFADAAEQLRDLATIIEQGQ